MRYKVINVILYLDISRDVSKQFIRLHWFDEVTKIHKGCNPSTRIILLIISALFFEHTSLLYLSHFSLKSFVLQVVSLLRPIGYCFFRWIKRLGNDLDYKWITSYYNDLINFQVQRISYIRSYKNSSCTYTINFTNEP